MVVKQWDEMKRFDGKVVLVTGGGSGIGAAIAKRFKDEGAWVFIAQRRAIKSESKNISVIQADLIDPNVPQHLIAEIVKKAGRLDVLVNNAGMMEESEVEAMSLEQWQAHLALNLTAPFLLIKAALPLLKSRRGSIINIGSIEGLGANPRHAAYCASKAGLHGLTRAVAVDHGVDGVRCNAVAPGWIDTELNVDFVASMEKPEVFKKNISGLHPVGRTGSPDEVAALVAFLADQESGFITGQIYTIDGGRMAQLSLP